MDYKRWRGLLELIGVISVFGGLMLVAFEVRQANRIATAQAVMDLSSAYNQINSARFSDPDVARLLMLLEEPESFEITELDASKITGMGYHIHNIMWAAQVAHDNGLLSLEDLDNYRNDLAGVFLIQPGLIPAFVEIYETQPGKRDAYVFEPLAELAATWQSAGGDSQ